MEFLRLRLRRFADDVDGGSVMIDDIGENDLEFRTRGWDKFSTSENANTGNALGSAEAGRRFRNSSSKVKVSLNLLKISGNTPHSSTKVPL